MKNFSPEKYVQSMVYAIYGNSQENDHPKEFGARTQLKPPAISPQNLRVDGEIVTKFA